MLILYQVMMRGILLISILSYRNRWTLRHGDVHEGGKDDHPGGGDRQGEDQGVEDEGQVRT